MTSSAAFVADARPRSFGAGHSYFRPSRHNGLPNPYVLCIALAALSGRIVPALSRLADLAQNEIDTKHLEIDIGLPRGLAPTGTS
jgi:hypothetical protein